MKAGVSENNIEFTELFGDSVDGAFSRFEIRYIGLQSEHVLAELVCGLL